MSKRQKFILTISYLIWSTPVVIAAVYSAIYGSISLGYLVNLIGLVFALFIIAAPHLFIISVILRLYARSNCKNLFVFLRFIKEYSDYKNKPVTNVFKVLRIIDFLTDLVTKVNLVPGRSSEPDFMYDYLFESVSARTKEKPQLVVKTGKNYKLLHQNSKTTADSQTTKRYSRSFISFADSNWNHEGCLVSGTIDTSELESPGLSDALRHITSMFTSIGPSIVVLFPLDEDAHSERNDQSLRRLLQTGSYITETRYFKEVSYRIDKCMFVAGSHRNVSDILEIINNYYASGRINRDKTIVLVHSDTMGHYWNISDNHPLDFNCDISGSILRASDDNDYWINQFINEENVPEPSRLSAIRSISCGCRQIENMQTYSIHNFGASRIQRDRSKNR